MCMCVGACGWVGVCVCMCGCVGACVGVYVCTTTGVGGRKKSAFRISNISSSLRGTKIEIPKTPKMNTEHEAGSTQGRIYQNQIKISELKRLL